MRDVVFGDLLAIVALWFAGFSVCAGWVGVLCWVCGLVRGCGLCLLVDFGDF